ncbi:MAG: Fic family protein [Lamprobacter sp.]|uniref:Fic family protein n=1 Tax=Lamprobacter sp. TaxID=3100796 RepID=UPI002B25E7EE|nr:Fic family protein [Lamprobacter sp.]MEA3642124.1 Fic family protein [Lamprobacter sp.]
MPKQISTQELETILAIVAAHPDGVQIQTIREGLANQLPPRMLQRRLALLLEQKRLVAEGQGKGRRYRVPVTITGSANLTLGKVTATARAELYVPISPEGLAIKESVRAPIQHRQPIGYRRAFLDDYRPNETWYLPSETRQRLLEMGRPPGAERPAGTYARIIYNRLLIDLSWNSSRLEGNTYSLLETERLLELGEVAEGKDALEAQMILNHKGAIELLVEQASEIGFHRYTILNLRGLLADNLLADPLAGGRLRRIGVGIDGTVYHPLEVPQLIEECFRDILDTAAAIADPFEQAFFALVHLAYLQPFEDVNKRVSRLAANIPLIRDNLCPLSFVDVPERAYIDGVLGVYELNRIELLRDVFVWAYQRSCARYSAVRQSLGEPDPFRLRYRTLVAEVVATLVRAGLDKKATTALVRQRAAEQLPLEDQARFVEVVETEMMSLHEGNIARYRLRPSEYQAWRQGWR